MALDQNSDSNKTPIVNVPEEPLIITSSNPPLQPFFIPGPGPGTGTGPVRFDLTSNPPMMPVSGYGYPHVGFVNPNMVWPPRVDPHPPPPTTTGSGFVRGVPNLGTSVSGGGGGGGAGIDQGDPTGGGFVRAPNVGSNVSGVSGGGGGTGIDRGSEEGGGGDDSVSGKKVKFMCSFGGKILPRPSDGLLRYVGGQTRIISVRRDVTFGELVRKMMDTYGQPVLIKYQLPDEDLDALVSVSCPDDVDNMMEEYEKLIERSPDGSAKLRVFLFSGPDVDGLGFGGGGSNDGGQRYLDAVNGVGEGVVGGGIIRKESIASFASTQNSDVSGSEVFETVVGQEVSGPPSSSMFSPRSDSAASYDNTPRVEISAPPVVVPAGMSSHPASSQLEIESERVPILAYGQQQPPPWGYDLQQPGMNIQPRAPPYVGSYMDPHQDVLNRGASQMVYANPQVLGAPRPMLVHPQYRDSPPNLLNQQYLPAVQMTMAPTSSHMSMNPNIMQPVVQPSHRVVTVPTESGHSNAFQTPVGGGYGWPQAPSQDHVTFSEGYMPHQQVVITTPDCYMCQKALPHTHSDSIVQDQRVSQPPNVSGTNPIHQSLRIDDVSKFYAPQNQVGLVTDAQTYGGVRGNVPVSSLEDTIQPHFVTSASSQLQNEPPVSKPVNSDSVGGVAYHAPEQFIPEISHVPAMIYRDDGARPAIPNDFATPNDFKMENLPADNLSSNEQGKFPVDQLRKDDMFEHMTPQTMGREVLPNAETGSLHSNVLPATSPHNWGAIGNDTANSLFSNQDPWNMRHETHFPPKPSKIGTKGEAFTIDNHLNGGGQNIDANFADSLSTAEQVQAGKGSAEERIKEQLQATAEGVAASVLHSSVPSNDYSDTNISEENHEIEGQSNSDAVIQTKMEAMNIKSDKANFGLPLSDGLGRLQIIKNSDLEELQELGSGTFGTVYHGKWRGTDVAIKRINDRCFAGKPSEEERMRNDFWNEAINLADLHHPNVVAFYGVVLDGPGGFVATVTEYMVNGSLRTALQKKERSLDKRKRLLIAMDVAFGMEYLHSKNIVHFDLKSDNLLVNLRDPHRPICKVGDLGLSKVKCQTLISGGVRGTLPWMAPELLNGSSSRVSEKVDVFSFGVVMWELLTGEEPYADLHYGAIIGGIVSNTLRPSIPENCDPEWRSLMERCWAAEPTERPTFTKIAEELRCMASKIPVKNQTPATTTRTNS